MNKTPIERRAGMKNICAACATALDGIIDLRIRAILSLADEDGGEGERARAESQCFHLMELQSILHGQKTCGVFDDFGDPRTIKGPLFDRVEVSR